VFGVENDTDSLGGQVFLQPVRHLLGAAFPHLQVTGEQLHHAASVDSPRIRAPGRYATCATPWNGTRWCSHRDCTGMFRATTHSS
jgi:hypothetical protein